MLQLIAQTQQFGSGLESVSTLTDTAETVSDPLAILEDLTSYGVGLLTSLAGIFFIVYFVMGALKWVTAGGESSKVQKARDEMIQGALGLVLVVAAYGVVGLIGTVVGVDILTPKAVLEPFIPTP